ncbi:MAG: hypothetical protein QM617_09075 [Comamonas sp.]
MATDALRARQRAKGPSVQVGRSVSGSVINTGAGISIAIYQAAPVAAAAPVSAPANSPDPAPTLAGLIDDVLALRAKEQDYFAKFIRTNFGGLPLGDVDDRVLRRIQAYVDKIFESRDDIERWRDEL